MPDVLVPVPVLRVLGRLANVRQVDAARWSASCPAHADQVASLSVGVGREGRCLLHCFAGCSLRALVDALGLTTRDLFAARGKGRWWHG